SVKLKIQNTVSKAGLSDACAASHCAGSFSRSFLDLVVRFGAAKCLPGAPGSLSFAGFVPTVRSRQDVGGITLAKTSKHKLATSTLNKVRANSAVAPAYLPSLTRVMATRGLGTNNRAKNHPPLKFVEKSFPN